jgi:uncharacterized delta-60 repeat protein
MHFSFQNTPSSNERRMSFQLRRQAVRGWHTSQRVRTFFTCVFALTLAITITQAAPGALDPSFGAATDGSFGKLIRAVGSGTAGTSLNAVVVQPNGMIVVGGTCNVTLTGGGNDGLPHAMFCLQRYRAPSFLITQTWTDSSFGTAGTVILPIFQNRNAQLNSIAIAPDGKIVVAGTCSLAGTIFFCVTRLLSNGALDPSFAPNGLGIASVYIPTTGNMGLTTMLLQPDGRIVLVGECLANDVTNFCLARLQANGEPDASFGTNGTLLSVTDFDRYPRGAVLRADGAILVSGLCYDFGANFCVRSYTALGATDTNFGPSAANPTRTLHISMGTATIDASGGIARTASGKFLISGSCIDTPTAPNRIIFCTTRITDNGSLDSSFGTNGVNARAYNVMSSGHAEALGIVVAPDGKYLVGGQCDNGGSGGLDGCAARYHSDGRLDESFSNDGIIGNITSRAAARANAFALQADGKLVIGSTCTDGGLQKFCTSRLLGGPYGYRQCSMDIDGDGRVLGTTDAIIHSRIVAGMSGEAVLNGLSFPPNARRTTWAAIRDYLSNHCGMPVAP